MKIRIASTNLKYECGQKEKLGKEKKTDMLRGKEKRNIKKRVVNLIGKERMKEIYLTWSWKFCARRESKDLFADFLKPYEDKMYGGGTE